MNFQDIEIFYNDSHREYLAVDLSGVVVFKASDKQLFWQGLNKIIGFAVINTGYKDGKVVNKQILQAE